MRRSVVAEQGCFPNARAASSTESDKAREASAQKMMLCIHVRCLRMILPCMPLADFFTQEAFVECLRHMLRSSTDQIASGCEGWLNGRVCGWIWSLFPGAVEAFESGAAFVGPVDFAGALRERVKKFVVAEGYGADFGDSGRS